MKVARGGEQLQQLSQLPLCEGSAHKDKLLGRCQHPSLHLATFLPSEHWTQTSYELFGANGTITSTYGCITLQLNLGPINGSFHGVTSLQT